MQKCGFSITASASQGTGEKGGSKRRLRNVLQGSGLVNRSHSTLSPRLLHHWLLYGHFVHFLQPRGRPSLFWYFSALGQSPGLHGKHSLTCGLGARVPGALERALCSPPCPRFLVTHSLTWPEPLSWQAQLLSGNSVPSFPAQPGLSPASQKPQAPCLGQAPEAGPQKSGLQGASHMLAHVLRGRTLVPRTRRLTLGWWACGGGGALCHASIPRRHPTKYVLGADYVAGAVLALKIQWLRRFHHPPRWDSWPSAGSRP